jgi:hypothetical protein
MAYETFPKSGKHPSMSVDSQDSTSWPSGSKTKYPAGGLPRVGTDKCKVVSVSGGSGSPNGSDYGKSRTSFATEKFVGKK